MTLGTDFYYGQSTDGASVLVVVAGVIVLFAAVAFLIWITCGRVRGSRDGKKKKKRCKKDDGCCPAIGPQGAQGPAGSGGAYAGDLIDFGAPLDETLLNTNGSFLVPWNHGATFAVQGATPTTVSLVTAGTSLIGQTLPVSSPATYTAHDPTVTLTVLTAAFLNPDTTFTLGTLTGTGLTQTFTPSTVLVTVPGSGLMVLGTTKYSNTTSAVFPAGAQLAVQVITAGQLTAFVGSASFDFLLSTP